MKQLKSFRGRIAVIACALILATLVLPAGVFGAAEQNITVKIINNNSSAVSNYQVKIPFNTAKFISEGNMASDCSDLLVKNSSQQNLPYYIEPGSCNRSDTAIWVKISSLPASPGAVNLTFNFGTNNNNSGYNSGTSVFDFFDTFKSNTLGTKWATNYGSGTFTTSDSTQASIDTANEQAIIKSGYYGAMTTMSNATTPIKFNRTAENGLVAEARIKATNYTGYAGGIMYYDPQVSINYNQYSYHSFPTLTSNSATSGQIIRYGVATLSNQGPTQSYSLTPDNWYIHQLVLGNTNEQIVKATVLDENSGAQLSYTDLKTEKSDADFSYNDRAFALDRYESGTTYVDWFRVRKYLSSPPTVQVEYPSGGNTGTCDGVSFGYETVAQSFCSFVVGRFNEISGNSSTWVETDTLFVVGNGTDANNRSDAFSVMKNGDLKVTGDINTQGDICIGQCN